MITSAEFSKTLFSWYKKNKRDLPWRQTKDPYKIWVSEIMLQQTQVERVKGFYKRFLERFPDVKSFAKAPWKEVLECWRGLGYYRRARNLHEAAKIVVEKYKGKFPRRFEEMLELPGVGRYTAAAISSFAFDQAVPAIDTNAEAVFRHVFGVNFWKNMKPAKKFLWAKSLISQKKGADFNHALMDFGSFLKSLKEHKDCPFAGYCEGALEPPKKMILVKLSTTQRKLVSKLKKRTSSQKMLDSYIKVAAGVLIHKGKVLIAKRKKEAILGGFWEFPGGKLEKGEDERSCLKREMKEELGIEVSVRPAFCRMNTQHEKQTYRVSFHRCSLLYGRPKAFHVAKFEWIRPEQFSNYNFLPANVEVLKLLQKKKAMFRV